MPRLEKFFKNALKASSSWNRREIGAELEDEEAPERRGFQVGVDLCLSAIDMTNVNRKRCRKKKRQSEKLLNNSNIASILKWSTYVWEMHEHVTSKVNCIMGLAQSNPTSTQSIAHIYNA